MLSNISIFIKLFSNNFEKLPLLFYEKHDSQVSTNISMIFRINNIKLIKFKIKYLFELSVVLKIIRNNVCIKIRR